MSAGVKQIYFIRHGETGKNRKYKNQGPEEPLNERGRAQAAALADFLRDKQIDTIITSDYVRARQTADILAETLNLTLVVDQSLREFGPPASLSGRSHFSPASINYLIKLYRYQLKLLWRTDGVESLASVRERIHDAKVTIEDLPGERIAVVSHRLFITMFIETVCYHKPLSFIRFLRGLLGVSRIPNTAVIHFLCQPNDYQENKCSWFLEKIIRPPYNRSNNLEK